MEIDSTFPKGISATSSRFHSARAGRLTSQFLLASSPRGGVFVGDISLMGCHKY